MKVIKVSGQLLAGRDQINEIARILAQVPDPILVVHGGGPRIDQLQQELGLPINKVDGLRVTDQPTLSTALMVLCGEINKSLVAAMVENGIGALGLSGVDGSLFRVEKLPHSEHDLGFVGQIVEVNSELLNRLHSTGMTLVVAPLASGPNGQIYNVNADQVASALAVALGASELHMLSNVSGVHVDGTLVTELNHQQVELLIGSGEINGGMIPKVRSGIEALLSGVPRVRIANPQGLVAGTGTSLYLEGKD